jgi:hypothetical protein
MTSTDKYDDEILSYLARYPIDAADALAIQHAGKHRRLSFWMSGRRFTLTLPRSPTDRKAAVLKIGDIRKLLGPPPDDGGKPTKHRELADLTADVEARAAKNGHLEPLKPMSSTFDHASGWPCRVALRESNRCVIFDLPADVARQLRDDKLLAEFVPPLSWRIEEIKEPKGRFTGAKMRGQELAAGGLATMTVLGAFSFTAAECHWNPDGSLLVTLTEPPRRTSAKAPTKEVAEPKELVAEETKAPEAAQAAAPIAAEVATSTPFASDRARLRAVLVEVARLEAETPYRLRRVRDTGRHVWRAEDVTEEG